MPPGELLSPGTGIKVKRAIAKFLGCAVVVVVTACSTQGPLKPGTGATSEGVSKDTASDSPVAKRVPKFGLALGGGAARGFAHVGVIQVLEEAGIKPDYVVGTSAGSLVAAFYASGKNGAQLQQLSETMDEATITDWTIPLLSRGMMRGDALARYVNSKTGNQKIEDLPMSLGIVATDLQTGQGVLFQRGDLGTAVRASSSVPSVFEPVKIGTREFVDGGLVSPVPVRFARQMGAEFVLAVDISSTPENAKTGDMFQILMQTFTIMGKSINNLELREADVVVRPALGTVGSAEFSARRKSIEAGRAAMLAALPKVRVALLPR
ncbi:MAG: patatin-like phospholipase family protein [Betaproteobacteria bacterium]|nr:patatin-like phospholipase family protein [Betaproteobacteria bacterium]